MKILMYIVIGLLALILLGAVAIFLQNRKPNIELGLVDGRLREIPSSPNCVSTQTEQVDKRIEPIAFKESLEDSKLAMKAAIEAYGGIELMEEQGDYIYAVATTSVMKFHDDIEIYFDQEAQLIHYRSASRAGYSDMGLNLERYEAIVQYYKEH
jgi:uncharacterized protein (DUF1499 family)